MITLYIAFVSSCIPPIPTADRFSVGIASFSTMGNCSVNRFRVELDRFPPNEFFDIFLGK